MDNFIGNQINLANGSSISRAKKVPKNEKIKDGKEH